MTSLPFHAHVEDGRYRVCSTTNGLDHTPVHKAIYDKPADAIRVARARNQNIQPLRDSAESPGAPPSGDSAE